MARGDKEMLLEARIAILRDKCIEQSHTFDKMNNKIFALVGLLLTLGGLLTYGAFKIKLPDTILEYMVFITALACLSFTAALVAYDYRTKKTWSVPIGPVEEEKLNNTTNYLAGLKIIHDDYLLTNQERDRVLDRKARVLNISLHTLIVGIILLAALKIGG